MTNALLQPEPLLFPQVKCTTGCDILDSFLIGGITVGSITELVGESTAGKTQLCLQLLLAVQLPLDRGGLAGKGVYIHTEGNAPVERLRQIAPRFTSSPEEQQAFQEGILVQKAVDGPAQLWNVLQQAVTLVESGGLHPPIRLLVVDSIANVFRDYDTSDFGDLSERSAALYHISCLLKQLAHRHRIAVVLTNHVVDIPDSDNPAEALSHAEMGTCGGRRLETSGRRVAPALGLLWSQCVTTRLFVSRCASLHPVEALTAGQASSGGTGSTLSHPPGRRLEVVFAPNLASGAGRAQRYRIATDGVWGTVEDH